MDNQEKWHHRVQKTKKNKTKAQQQLVLDTTIRKQTQITYTHIKNLIYLSDIP